MRAGELKDRVTIEVNARTRSATTGDYTDVWSTVATVSGKFLEPRARELQAGEQTVNEATRTLMIRWRGDLTDKMQVKYADPKTNATRYFYILKVRSPDERRGSPMYIDLRELNAGERRAQ